mmetsp:Transcript_51561/g.167388  ORF Transcript_51561/g.167388 Transcript_51561/m.167388 type:complete len:268 (+) Transcript_51561:305-1108(+)
MGLPCDTVGPLLLSSAPATGAPGVGHVKVVRVCSFKRSHTTSHAARNSGSELSAVASTARPAMRNCTPASSSHQQHSAYALPPLSAWRTCLTFSARKSVTNISMHVSSCVPPPPAPSATRLGMKPRNDTVRTEGLPLAGSTVANCTCLRLASLRSRFGRFVPPWLRAFLRLCIQGAADEVQSEALSADVRPSSGALVRQPSSERTFTAPRSARSFARALAATSAAAEQSLAPCPRRRDAAKRRRAERQRPPAVAAMASIASTLRPLR